MRSGRSPGTAAGLSAGATAAGSGALSTFAPGSSKSSKSSKSFRTSTSKTLPAFVRSWPSRVILVRFVFAQLENGFCRVDRMGEEERRAAKALGYSAARWESGVDAPAADKQ